MIQIKDKVNKTQLFKELTEIGKKRFEFTCEPDEDLKVFIDGAEALFKLLRLPVVSNSVICCPQCGNERLESMGDGWYICCDKDCDWGDKL